MDLKKIAAVALIGAMTVSTSACSVLSKKSATETNGCSSAHSCKANSCKAKNSCKDKNSCKSNNSCK